MESAKAHEAPVCPACGGRAFTVWAWPHPVVVHWCLNPGLVLIELLLGLRIPKRTLICETCCGPFAGRTYFPCPSCGAMHANMTYMERLLTRHWLGWVCPACGEPIPCLWNAWSLLVLAATSPVWYLPVRWLRPRWIASERRRMAEAEASPAWLNRLRAGVEVGIAGGAVMWLLMSSVHLWKALADRDALVLWQALVTLPAWVLGMIALSVLWRWAWAEFSGRR
jgi:hypothetical protein